MYIYMYVCMDTYCILRLWSHVLFIQCVFTVEFCVCCCRQQIEDCEREVGRLKDLVKKKEDNEKKYQGTVHVHVITYSCQT